MQSSRSAGRRAHSRERGLRADATKDGAPQPLLGMCGICHDPLEDGIAAACGHSFCRVCVTEYLDNSVGATDCPTCQRPLTIDLTAPSTAAADAPPPENGGGRVEKFKKRSILNRINTRAFQSSTKLEALNEAIQRMLAADPSAKCIVFSQFTSMLDLANFRLQQVRHPQQWHGARCSSSTLAAYERLKRSHSCRQVRPGLASYGIRSGSPTVHDHALFCHADMHSMLADEHMHARAMHTCHIPGRARPESRFVRIRHRNRT